MIEHDKLEFLWSQKYRPQKVADCILPDDLKAKFQAIASGDRVPSMLLTGTAGVGKTTIAKALCMEAGAEYMLINASNENGIDTLRTKIAQFASTVSFFGAKKVIILDEADSLTGPAQTALRAFVEDVSKNTTFILTANYKNKIIEPLRSRFPPIEFRIKASDKPQLAGDFMKRAEIILKQEKIEYDKRVLVEVISKFFPDFRRILNELQHHSATGTLDPGILTADSVESFRDLIKALKANKFNDVRKWVAQNADDSDSLYSRLYDISITQMEPASIPELILILAKYQHQEAFVKDKELNTMAAMVEIMRSVRWKS
jgi:DNA polymerase III delta prime subunit